MPRVSCTDVLPNDGSLVGIKGSSNLLRSWEELLKVETDQLTNGSPDFVNPIIPVYVSL